MTEIAAPGLLEGVKEVFYFNGRDLSICKFYRNVPVETQILNKKRVLWIETKFEKKIRSRL